MTEKTEGTNMLHIYTASRIINIMLLSWIGATVVVTMPCLLFMTNGTLDQVPTWFTGIVIFVYLWIIPAFIIIEACKRYIYRHVPDYVDYHALRRLVHGNAESAKAIIDRSVRRKD